MASYNLEDVAQLWYIQLQEDKGTPPWGRFKELLNLRFRPPLRAAPLFELAECRQTGTVEDYSNKFQALLPRAGRLAEAQRVQLYTGGLLPPMSHAVHIHYPETLAASMSLARQVEMMGLAQQAQPPGRSVCGAWLPPPGAQGTRPPLPTPPAGATPLPPERQPLKRLSQEEQAERRRHDLCFNCNEPYNRGHNRVCRRIFFMDGIEIEGADDDQTSPNQGEDAPVFSLQAIAGVPIYKSLQVQASLGAATVVALLDTGSTHNFIAEAAARQTGLHIQRRPRLTAMVANGERVSCPGVIRRAPVIIKGDRFYVDLFVMPLAGYDLVLGTQWMVTLGRVTWDFIDRTISFAYQGRSMCWSDVEAGPLSWVTTVSATEGLLDDLLQAFDSVFAEPSGLPPQRARDHTIILKPGAAPVAVRPYRYPAAHKDELERQCAAMIAQGIVRRSDSVFSSGVLLVKKQDGAWRFCVDYRALNALTVKDAFPIPVVDELLDELHGTRYFTKLDLRSGYHQVWMRPADIHKTAFCTHDNLYEFLVMTFGLCNAPTTFQALMNDVLRSFLCRFVLVFFDDILIYSRTWADHSRHIRAILDELRCHVLFIKRSKCSFGASSVAYLGHVISAQGWPWIRPRCRLSTTGQYRARRVRCAASWASPDTTASSSTTTARTRPLSPHYSRRRGSPRTTIPWQPSKRSKMP
jgi:hypothetical protein